MYRQYTSFLKRDQQVSRLFPNTFPRKIKEQHLRVHEKLEEKQYDINSSHILAQFLFMSHAVWVIITETAWCQYKLPCQELPAPIACHTFLFN